MQNLQEGIVQSVELSDILSDTEIREGQTVFRGTSHSRLSVFEKCRLWAKLAFIDKVPEPPRPLPPGKTEHANDRGTRIHTGGELFVTDNVELLPELETFRPEYEALRDLYRANKVQVEQEWAVDRDWNPTDWKSSDVFYRIKLDAFVRPEPWLGAVIDLKTGKLKGNEIKHLEQGQLYVLAAFMRYPDLEECSVEFWYPDVEELTRVEYTKKQALRLLRTYTERGLTMVNADEFPPNPSVFNCKWCPYGPDGTGHCKDGVSKNQPVAASKFQAKAASKNNWWEF